MTRTVQGKILVFIIFFLGLVAGGLLTRAYETRVEGGSREDSASRARRAQSDMNAFHDYLGLDESQREAVKKILGETGKEFSDLRAQTQPQFKAIRERSREKIRAVMTDEQRQKYDEYIKKNGPRGSRRN
jgi:hypothetical protein